MKSYTDIKQGQILAEILPPESADMINHWYKSSITNDEFYVTVLGRNKFSDKDILCWSLTALVNVLPRIDIEKENWSSDKYDYRVKAFIGDGYVGDWYDNPIDACVDMIIKLKESNLLKLE